MRIRLDSCHILLAMCVSLSCLPESIPDSSQLSSEIPGESSAGLAAVQLTDPTRLWPSSLPICFELRTAAPDYKNVLTADGGTVVSADGGIERIVVGETSTLGPAPGFNYRPAMDQILLALDESWSASSSIVFVRTPTDAGLLCGTSYDPNNQLKIALRANSGFGGGCPGYYRGVACEVSAGFIDGSYTAYNGYLATHEVGHALGFGHEHQRAVDGGSWVDAGWEVALCDKYMNGVAADGEAVLFDDAGVLIVHGDLEPRPFSKLTRFDPFSAMNYCRDANGVQGQVIDGSIISSLDRLGIEMVYPRSAMKIDCLGGFPNSLFSQCVVRSAKSTVYQPRWLTIGALASAFASPTWTTSNSSFSSSTLVSVSATLPTMTTISTSSLDIFGRQQSGSIVVVADNARHTAVLRALDL